MAVVYREPSSQSVDFVFEDREDKSSYRARVLYTCRRRNVTAYNAPVMVSSKFSGFVKTDVHVMYKHSDKSTIY